MAEKDKNCTDAALQIITENIRKETSHKIDKDEADCKLQNTFHDILKYME